MQEKYNKLKKRYMKVYKELKESVEEGKKYESIKSKAKRMMLMLRDYYENGKIDPDQFNLIEIEFDDPLLFDGEDDQERENLLRKSKDWLITEIKYLRKKNNEQKVELRILENETEEKLHLKNKEVQRLKLALETIRIDLEGRYRENLDKLNFEHQKELKRMEDSYKARFLTGSSLLDKEEQYIKQINALTKQNEMYKISMGTREQEFKVLHEKIKKLDKNYKGAVDEKNSQVSKILNSSQQSGLNNKSKGPMLKSKLAQKSQVKDIKESKLVKNSGQLGKDGKPVDNIEEEEGNMDGSIIELTKAEYEEVM